MHLNVNGVQHSPTFGQFKFIGKETTDYIESHINEFELDNFRKVVEKENKNEMVEATISTDVVTGRLKAYLRIFENGMAVGKFCKEMKPQGMFKSITGYLEKVSKASSKLLEKYNTAKLIEEVVKDVCKK